MTQKVEITLTLEVDAEKNKQDIIDFINWKLNTENFQDKWFEIIEVKSIKEESEIYQTE